MTVVLAAPFLLFRPMSLNELLSALRALVCRLCVRLHGFACACVQALRALACRLCVRLQYTD